MNWICRIFGHRWIDGDKYRVCARCLVDTSKGWPPMPRPIMAGPNPPPPPEDVGGIHKKPDHWWWR